MTEEKKPQLEKGQRLGAYIITGFIARGGMGEVYSAIEGKLQREVAIKVISPELSQEKKMVERFVGEGTALAKISHPNIVTVYAVGEENGLPYIVMEFIEGIPLNELIKSRSLLVVETIQILEQILSALIVSHGKSIIHRDIKPQNIIIDLEGRTKLIDFGVVKNLVSDNPTQTTHGMVIGSVAYMCPEAISGKTTTVQSDLWAVGVTLYEMLVGALPFQGKNNLEMMDLIKKGKWDFPDDFDTWCPKELKKILLKICHPQVDQRYQAASEILDDIQKFKDNHKEFNSEVAINILQVENDAYVLDYLNGYSESEKKQLIAWAARYQQILDADSDRTFISSSSTKIKVSDSAIKHAESKFHELRYEHKVQKRNRALFACAVGVFTLALIFVSDKLLNKPENSWFSQRKLASILGSKKGVHVEESCSPYGKDEGLCAPRGLNADLYYLSAETFNTFKGQEHERDNKHNKLPFYFENGERVEGKFFFRQAFIYPKTFMRGVLSDDNRPIVDSEGNKLIEFFAFHMKSILWLDHHEPGLYQFALSSDDGSQLFIVDENHKRKRIIENDGPHPMNFICSDPIPLEKGVRLPIEVEFYQGPRYNLGLILFWRRVDEDSPHEPHCGLKENLTGEIFGDSYNDLKHPEYMELLERGWEIIPHNNFLLLPEDS